VLLLFCLPRRRLNDEKEEEEKEWDGLIVLARLSGRTSKKKKTDALSLSYCKVYVCLHNA